MERLVSGVSHSPDSADPVWEERLIWSLSELSRAPRQGPDAQGSSPEMEAEEWGEEMAERVELGAELTSTCDLEQEKEEKREEGEGEEKEGEGEGEERHYRGGQCIGVFQYLGESANNNSEEEEDGEEDPLVKAESLRFDCSICYNLEEQKEQPDTEEQEQECDSEEVEELRDPEEQEDFDEQEDEWDTVRQEESEEEELFLTVEHMENSCVGWVEPMSGTLRQRRRTEAS
ncbi:hypothetical protein JZ751_018448 [Albula glossodonta]|uniref:Uncharacterized protein n=1 Tax=Albula glossodonta TaxID=121402 RepID=A0A8T2MU91_9TELE|nr:hypothetical protein JZ751_018448 [Albula glossodonta]